MANIYNFADTWDNAAVAWVGVGVDITDSASDAASRLLKLSVNSVETFAVRKDGAVVTGSWQGTAIGPTKGGTGLTSFAAGDIIYASGVNTLAKLSAGTNGHVLTLSSGVPVWAAPGGGASAPLTLASGTLANPSPALTITQTWNDAADAFAAALIDITNTAAANGSSALTVKVGSAVAVRIGAYASGVSNHDSIAFGTNNAYSILKFSNHLNFGDLNNLLFAMGCEGGNAGILKVKNDGAFGFSYIANPSNDADLKMTRGASNVLRVSTTSNAPAGVRLGTFTVSGLPAASSHAGALAFASDATATTARSTVAGGGSNFVMVMSDGTNWLIVA